MFEGWFDEKIYLFSGSFRRTFGCVLNNNFTTTGNGSTGNVRLLFRLGSGGTC
jgi:hypothetical protein